MSLSDLPTELIVQIFKSAKKINSAAALSHTSRQLHSVWRYHLASICDAVLPRTIECYDEVHLLLEARANSTLVTSQSSVEDKAKAAIVQAKMLFANADLADAAFKEFETQFDVVLVHGETTVEQSCKYACPGTCRDRHGGIVLEASCRIRFLQAYHRAMSIGYLGGKSATKRYQLLASLHLLDLFRMIEVMHWISYNYPEEAMPDDDTVLPGYDPGPHGQDGYLYLGERGVIDGSDFLKLLEKDLAVLSGITRPNHDTFPERIQSYYLILHEDCMADLIKATTCITLADLLPRLPKNNSINPDYELSAPEKLQLRSGASRPGVEVTSRKRKTFGEERRSYGRKKRLLESLLEEN